MVAYPVIEDECHDHEEPEKYNLDQYTGNDDMSPRGHSAQRSLAIIPPPEGVDVFRTRACGLNRSYLQIAVESTARLLTRILLSTTSS